MIAPAKRCTPAWHTAFIAMLPAIQTHARIAFSDRDPESREDLVQEVIANCLVAYVRLVELGKQDLAYPTVLAMYAVRQIHDGRRVGGKLNVRDVSSRHAQRNKGIKLERLDRYNKLEGKWLEAVVEDYQTPVPDQVAFRIDFPQWLATLSPRNRQIAEKLAMGERTNKVAKEFGVSAGRISQLRRELKRSWEEFIAVPA